jgi:hypothetical protein
MIRRASLALLALFGATLALAGCSTIAPPEDRTAQCEVDGAIYVLWFETLDREPGASTPLRVLRSDQYHGWDEVPGRCISRWEVRDPSVATLSPDHTVLTVRPDAPGGATTFVTARIGKASATGELRVFRRDEQPLVGFWRQDSNECVNQTPLLELAIRADGSFAATWMPFESYKDYWGQWRFDRETGQLDLSVEPRGNYIPPDVASGHVVLDGDTLEMRSASFGSPRNGAACAAPFRRSR